MNNILIKEKMFQKTTYIFPSLRLQTILRFTFLSYILIPKIKES